ncbi:MAG: hypothetical protein PQJ50_07475, partial [Spirochaetales bacterium]|nr:hypothetical protein [Spirochaetales bacterium]
MKYYQLHHDSDEKNVGAYEQITGLTVPFTKEKMDAFLNMQLCREDYMDPLPDLSQFELLHRAVLTDVLSFSHLSMNEGFLCNGKVKSVLEEMH